MPPRTEEAQGLKQPSFASSVVMDSLAYAHVFEQRNRRLRRLADLEEVGVLAILLWDFAEQQVAEPDDDRQLVSDVVQLAASGTCGHSCRCPPMAGSSRFMTSETNASTRSRRCRPSVVSRRNSSHAADGVVERRYGRSVVIAS